MKNRKIRNVHKNHYIYNFKFSRPSKYLTLKFFEHEKDVEIAKKRSQLPIAQERQRLVDMIRNNKVNIIVKEYYYDIFKGSHRKRRNWFR